MNEVLLRQLLARVTAMTEDDALWRGFMAMLDGYVVGEQQTLAQEQPIGDELAHMGRGRLAMALQFKADLETLWRETHGEAGAAGSI